MRHPYLLLAALALSHAAAAQLSGTKTIDPAGAGPDNYATVTAAVQALNAGGVGPGGVTFRVKAGATFTETIPALTASGTAANPIRFTKDGPGGLPVLQQVGSGTTDAVLTLDGADYVRLDSLVLRDNPSNSGVAHSEFGLWLKGGATNNRVEGCRIELNRSNPTRSYGVYLLDGGNNANRFYNNAVSNCTVAYYFVGPSANNDSDNEIGTLPGGRSEIRQLGIPATGGPPATGSVYAVYLSGQQQVKVFGLDISDVQGPGSVYGLYSTGTNNSADLTDNRLSNFLTRATGSGILEVIYVNNGATHNILRNRIHDVRATGTTAFAVGIDITGGTTNNVVNNFVSGVQAPNSTAGTAVRALSLRGGTTNRVLHNTVLVEYAATVASNRSGAFFISGANTGGLVANNIFVNRVTGLTPGGGGVGAAFFKATASLATLAPGSGNNLYYSASPSAEHPIFVGVATPPVVAVTLADYQQLAAPAEQTSVSENPTFVDAAAGDLHLSPTVPTQAESAGQALAGALAVATDIDLETRSTTTPDIGADEGSFVRADLAGPAIVYTELSNTAALTNRTLSGVSITDPSGVNVAPGTRPRLYYKKTTDANAFGVANDASGNGWKWTETPDAASPFSFSLDVSKLRTAPAAGDSIEYFVVAQDLAATPNVGASPGAGFAATSVAAISSAPNQPNVFRVLGFLSGIKTVGVSAPADYPTLTAAVADLNRSQLGGNLLLRLIDADYPSETYPITINANPGTRPTPTATPNAVVIQPAAGTGPVQFSGSSSSPLLIIDASYVVLNGGGTAGTNRRLRLRNNGTGGASGVVFASGRNLIIQNTELSAGSSTTGYGVAFDGVVAGRIEDCRISRANVGVQLQSNCDSVRVQGNVIGAVAAAEKLGTAGVVVLSSQHFDVRDNLISGVTRAASPAVSGVQVSGTSREGFVRANVINDITHTGSTAATSYGAVGLRLASTDAAASVLVDANMIGNVLSYGDDGFAFAPHGIYVASGGGYNLTHNTVNLSGTLAGGATPVSAALAVNTGVTGLTAVNNILVNNLSVTPAGGKAHALLLAGAASALTTSNANDYVVSGPRGVLASVAGTDAATLPALRTATGADQRSVSVPPVFVSANDLHLTAADNCGLEGKALALPGTWIDIDGEARSTTPDIGADEFVGTGCVTAVAAARASWQTEVFPNPSAGQLTVEVRGAARPLQLEVLDVLGRPVYRAELRAGTASHPLDLSGQAAGVYLLRLSSGAELSTHRVVLR
ncbi:T9SS type A sorting domain-containing protein [Hymenobacter sp. B81]|uniref:T9SS type A sorting domain-containing protein n=1 Tax=Hymenobacter sp. B81 TaxID=3344878 RepID=UPI0037DDC82C